MTSSAKAIEQAIARASGAPLVAARRLVLLKDADDNFSAWLEAIARARSHILFETYIFEDDSLGRAFIATLAERARSGVQVFLLYDWLGSAGKTSRRLFMPLLQAGGKIRCFNPPHFDSPFGWLSRDHRKSIVVDDEVGFVSGLCVSKRWYGERFTARHGGFSSRNERPWRDNGLKFEGQAVLQLRQAFASMWSQTGVPLVSPEKTYPEFSASSLFDSSIDTRVRIIAATPNSTSLFRLDQLMTTLVQERLWLTDAYFVGVGPYVQALRAAAQDGVDVRLLVPGTSDLPWIKPMSQLGYRPLLEAGVRVFEWKGSMLHAKTAIADKRWARVGSTNLNVASWVGSYELDVAVEDAAFVEKLEATYLADLENASEIILHRKHRALPLGHRLNSRGASGSLPRAAASALRIGNTLRDAVSGQRVLARNEARILWGAAAVLAASTVLALKKPSWVTKPLALFTGWNAIALALKGMRMRENVRRRQRRHRISHVPWHSQE